jgi:hypothetical protein|eukprot:TRINITY_DN1062_c0_g1_i1.p2 TRINITY_DN1062_c0_g1~~TRINITY_DN1062_c0_g1_i1.p2  ORF type:complete len:300 (+),score=77.82 TRINITY_DN1062_c0_g1_i1:76-900(+)
MVEYCTTCCAADDSKEVIIGSKADRPPGVPVSPGSEVMQGKDENPHAVQEAPAIVEEMESPKVEPEESKEEPPEPEPPAAVPPAEEEPVQEAPEVKSEQPPPRIRHLEIGVRKVNKEFGLDVDHGDNVTLKVIKIKPGAVSDWNTKNPLDAVKVDDRIISVNDISGSSEQLIDEVMKADELRIILKRTTELEITVIKDTSDQAIGLDIDANVLKVIKVKDGPIMNFNTGLDASYSEFAVRNGDKIVQVNRKNEREEMIKELKTQQTLNMVLFRA